MKILFLLFSICTSLSLGASTPDWSTEAAIEPGDNRANIYGLNSLELEATKNKGYIHAMNYPVTVTGLLIPYRPLLNFMHSKPNDPLKKFLLSISRKFAGFKTESELYEWLGLSQNNGPNAVGIYKMPYPNGKADQFYVGAGLIKNSHGEGLTFSCFACHANNLFGTTVMGLTNKRPHSNKFFHMARLVVPNIPNALFEANTEATKGEMQMFTRTKKNLVSIDGVVPQVHGLDTSLPHVALSLARRNNDEYATKNSILEKFPRKNELKEFVTDSKPMPWWNLKYKTRWLSDGSIVSGNPILTNFLWNEIGRGTDLVELENWMKNNSTAIKEITTAAFATEAPRYTDFFPPTSINIESAKRGEKLFNQTCLKCHGEYQKAWSGDNTEGLSAIELLATTKIIYDDQTQARDVGTDPNRYEAMKYFANELNNLAISKWMETKVEPQMGYVAPPLVGIWSRYPYFHNNSVPSLCAVLSLAVNRPKKFILGPSVNKEIDFDQECNGYPVGEKIPKAWLADTEALIDTSKSGLKNSGHEKMLLDAKGMEKYSSQDKSDLIQFLKTL